MLVGHCVATIYFTFDFYAQLVTLSFYFPVDFRNGGNTEKKETSPAASLIDDAHGNLFISNGFRPDGIQLPLGTGRKSFLNGQVGAASCIS
jgi:hypothetical protein